MSKKKERDFYQIHFAAFFLIKSKSQLSNINVLSENKQRNTKKKKKTDYPKAIFQDSKNANDVAALTQCKTKG